MRDSGTQRGRRKLTKQGDPEVRRLLYNAAMAAIRQPA
ncbi:transposase [Halomonas salifodinae]